MRYKLKYIFFMMLCFWLNSCGSPKFYNEIKSLYKESNNIEKNNTDLNTIFISIKDINVDKLFLRKLEDQLKYTDHIIYLYLRDNSMPTQKYHGVIYDVDQGLYYTLNYEKNNKNVFLESISDSLRNKYDKFVFINYLNDKCNYLKKLGNLSDHSGVRTSHAIYDVNLKDEIYKKCVFRDIFFTYYNSK